MAAASGQTQDTSKAKKQVTPEQRKLYVGLGIVGVLALITGAIYLPGLLSGSRSTAVTTPPVAINAATGTSAPSTLPLSGDAGQVSSGMDGAMGMSTSAGTTTLPSQALARFRRDPFQQAFFLPTPVPTLPPPPLPPAPVNIPSPSDVPPLILPGFNGGSAELQRPLNLPPVSIDRLEQGARRPTEAFPPARTLGGIGGGVATPSYDKRLSGVVIADGVRAILEIQGPAGPISHVVQPGDEVDGITILNIQRFNDGTRTVTRMLIRENGEERTVELRAGPPQTQSGFGGIGGPNSFGPPGAP
ncbi:hypothetical protein B1R32_103173 [Abditibacterium utsteinense]|uniref:Uncharacterized protein n=1 Tax=Abditibacterium utsteinense TaxID=1960156 RepID=A0A2S8SVS9_9BACT|nr:hypothetical protein [Abditibacterium utsteinense]PQV64906.1 hypothetical protein B1R32_103173 [Abditibacterium utsteinense]